MTFYYDTHQIQNRKRHSTFITSINEIISSPIGVVILGILTFVAFAFSLEVEFYTFVALYAIYVGVFADDFAPLMPLFVLCYVTPSKMNNPGRETGGLFYGTSGLYLIAIVSVAVLVLLIRIAVDKEMGYSRLFGTKRALLPGMLALGAAYLLSGILHPQYAQYAKGNLLFAFIQFASVCLLYFIFSATVDWDNFNFDYLATIGLVMGLVVAAEVGYTYYTVDDVVRNGIIYRGSIQTGWGCYNNIGAMISMSIPFAFYFAYAKRSSALFLTIACFLLLATFFTGSRGSIVGAVCIFIMAFVFTSIKAKNKVEFLLSSFLLVTVLIAIVWLFHDHIVNIFSKIPYIMDVEDDSVVVNDSSRFDYYINGIKVFLRNPIFGQGFYPIEYKLWSFADVDGFVSFFPPRWHNTIIQMLASCGTVGIVAYLYHRFSTLKLYFEKRNNANTYIMFYVAVLIAMSLLDCHFFNVGPVLFYSMAAAVVEFTPNTEEYEY